MKFDLNQKGEIAYVICYSKMLGRNLVYLRNKHKMSRAKLSSAVGMHWVSITRLEEENNFMIRYLYLKRICALFQVSMEEILTVDLKFKKR